jgi:hypothetical protein
MNDQRHESGDPLQDLAQRLRARDFSTESKVKDSLRRQFMQKAAGSYPFKPGYHFLPARKVGAALNRLAWGGLFLAFILTFAWNMGRIGPEPTRPARLVTAYSSFESGRSAGTVTVDGRFSITDRPAAIATPGRTELVSAVQSKPQPSLVPIPIPPSP